MMGYEPRAGVLEALRAKTLVMIVGPTAVGKSTVMNEVVRHNDDFRRVSGLTTREPRTNDESGLYRYISREQANAMIKDRSLVQYVINPGNDQLYATEPMDFPGRINLQDTLSAAVEKYYSLPFAHHIVVSLCAPTGAWLKWLLERYPYDDEARRKRLLEARQSIEWSLSQTKGHYWLLNQPDSLETTARTLIEICSHQTTTSQPDEPRKMLALIDSLL